MNVWLLKCTIPGIATPLRTAARDKQTQLRTARIVRACGGEATVRPVPIAVALEFGWLLAPRWPSASRYGRKAKRARARGFRPVAS